MPATRPLKSTGVKPPVPAAQTVDPVEPANPLPDGSERFELTYDKLVIAVGAYSQSMSNLRLFLG